MVMKKNKNWLYFIVGGWAVLVFSIMLALVLSSKVEPFDMFFGTVFERSGLLTSFMKGITFFGEAGTLILFGVLFTLFVRDKKDGAFLLLGLGICAGGNSLLKKIVRRLRPPIAHLIMVDGFSFPSGHSSSSMAFYGILIYLIYKKCKNKIVKWVSISFLSILVLAIGISRIYLGVHYPSDVVAGFSFAIFCLSVYVGFYEKMFSKK